MPNDNNMHPLVFVILLPFVLASFVFEFFWKCMLIGLASCLAVLELILTAGCAILVFLAGSPHRNSKGD